MIKSLHSMEGAGLALGLLWSWILFSMLTFPRRPGWLLEFGGWQAQYCVAPASALWVLLGPNWASTGRLAAQPHP